MHRITDDDILNTLRPDMDKARAYQAELSQEREKFQRWYRADITGMGLCVDYARNHR